MRLKQFDGVLPVRGLNLVVNGSTLQQFISSNMHFTVWQDLRCLFFFDYVLYPYSILSASRCIIHSCMLCPSVNVTPGVKEDRMMITGMHTVSDIFCVCCGSIVGWKYVRFVKIISQSYVYCLASEFYEPLLQEAAHEKNQRYKEGKYILER